MAWVDLSAAFAFGSKLTSAQMQNLRDNVVSAVQELCYYAAADEVSYASAAAWGTVITFPFICPERNTTIRLVAALKGPTSLTWVRARVGVNGSYSASYGEVTGDTYDIVDCSTHDISGLTPGTLYDGEIQMINEAGGTSYLKELVVTVGS